MKLNNRFIFGLLSILLAAVIAFVALPTIAKQTNGKTEIVRITKPAIVSVYSGRSIQSSPVPAPRMRCRISACAAS